AAQGGAVFHEIPLLERAGGFILHREQFHDERCHALVDLGEQIGAGVVEGVVEIEHPGVDSLHVQRAAKRGGHGSGGDGIRGGKIKGSGGGHGGVRVPLFEATWLSGRWPAAHGQAWRRNPCPPCCIVH